MIDKKSTRTVMFILAVVMFAVIAAVYLNREKSLCMGVKIADEADIVSSLKYNIKDLSDILVFGGQPAAVDLETNTVYIPQKIKKDTLYTEFAHKLVSSDENIVLYFAEDPEFSDMFKAMASGHEFKLFAVSDGEYMQCKVVFTSLPVISIKGEVVGKNEDERDIFNGAICVWNPEYKSTGAYNVQNSRAQWHYRGNSNYHVNKKSVKLSLKDEDSLNAELDLLGNGYEDDDWVLNAMYMDDTAIREKLVMDMWNELCTAAPYNYKMSTGEYVELVKDGKYQGLYLLENRVDGGYLELGEDQVLVKGQQGHESTDMGDHYRIIQSKYDEKLVWNRMKGLFNRDNGQYIHLDNWIDISLFVQFGYMTDNSTRYNTFYLIDNIEDNPSIKMILWDTDLALGIGWVDGKFTHSIDSATTSQRYRKEDESLRILYPQLDDMIAQRYAKLRKSTFSRDYIFKKIEKYNCRITESGAYARDGQLWGYRCKGEDTAEFLYSYIDARLGYLDEVYNLQ
ncbi:MAG: CotH kinase family protein [Oscillospiraceae bacterium]|nr:CotH kinase family protein [Oscillospiraceae bacterium]